MGYEEIKKSLGSVFKNDTNDYSKRELEKLGWKKLKASNIDFSLIQRKGYFEVFQNKHGLNITLFDDGGMTICNGSWSDVEPEELDALNKDRNDIKHRVNIDDEIYRKVYKDANIKEKGGIKAPDDYALTRVDFSIKGFGIIVAKNKTDKINIYVDDVNDCKQFKAEVITITDNDQEYTVISSSVTNVTIGRLKCMIGKPFEAALDLLQQCISKVRSM